jgi:hypothetical protein
MLLLLHQKPVQGSKSVLVYRSKTTNQPTDYLPRQIIRPYPVWYRVLLDSFWYRTRLPGRQDPGPHRAPIGRPNGTRWDPDNADNHETRFLTLTLTLFWGGKYPISVIFYKMGVFNYGNICCRFLPNLSGQSTGRVSARPRLQELFST